MYFFEHALNPCLYRTVMLCLHPPAETHPVEGFPLRPFFVEGYVCSYTLFLLEVLQEAHLGLLFLPETATVPSLSRRWAGLPLIGIGFVSGRCRCFRLMSSPELAWLINNSFSQQTPSLQGSWACSRVKHILCWPLYSASISTLTHIVDMSVLMR